jgi:hypothetical protein
MGTDYVRVPLNETGHPDWGKRDQTQPILSIFDMAITLVSEQINEYLHNFTIGILDSNKEKSYFHPISDIREDLSMIKRVVLQ